MRNKKLIIALVAAVTFGLVAAVSVSRYLSSAQAFTKNLNKVVVAKVEIPVGQKLIKEHLTVAQFPSNVTPEGAFSGIDQKLVGRVAVTRIGVREPVTESRLAPIGAAGGLSSVIPEGYRAMTVKVDDVVGVSGFIMPGTLVDIVVVMDPPKTGGTVEKISKIVLQNIKVLASGQNIDNPKNDREAQRVKAVTLQVTPEQAEKLALATNEGTLQLVMRNSVDQGDETTPGANKRTLLAGEGAMPVPEPGISGKSDTATSNIVRRPRPRRPAVVDTAMKVSTPAPSPQRPSIEVIEAAKKRTVEFP